MMALQVNTAGAWKNVAGFSSDCLIPAQHAATVLHMISGGQSKFRLMGDNGRELAHLDDISGKWKEEVNHG